MPAFEARRIDPALSAIYHPDTDPALSTDSQRHDASSSHGMVPCAQVAESQGASSQCACAQGGLQGVQAARGGSGGGGGSGGIFAGGMNPERAGLASSSVAEHPPQASGRRVRGATAASMRAHGGGGRRLLGREVERGAIEARLCELTAVFVTLRQPSINRSINLGINPALSSTSRGSLAVEPPHGPGTSDLQRGASPTPPTGASPQSPQWRASPVPSAPSAAAIARSGGGSAMADAVSRDASTQEPPRAATAARPDLNGGASSDNEGESEGGRGGSGFVVVLEGTPGSGKTSLAREAAAKVRTMRYASPCVLVRHRVRHRVRHCAMHRVTHHVMHCARRVRCVCPSAGRRETWSTALCCASASSCSRRRCIDPASHLLHPSTRYYPIWYHIVRRILP